MWTRKEVKEQGRAAFKLNYWRSVLVAFVLALIVGGASGSGFSISNPAPYASFNSANSQNADIDEDDIDDIAEDISSSFEGLDPAAQQAFAGVTAVGVAFFVLAMALLGLVITAIGIALDVLVFNPLQIGGNRFFVKNLDDPAKVSNIGYAFDCNYVNIIKTMFFRDLFIFLWALLFIIPGIVKSYEYRMIPYLLADDPNMTYEEAFARSKQMMTGNKWKAFVLDLSFIGWHILSGLTMGILGIFYVTPYVYSTNAALYRKLSAAGGSEVVAVEADEL